MDLTTHLVQRTGRRPLSVLRVGEGVLDTCPVEHVDLSLTTAVPLPVAVAGTAGARADNYPRERGESIPMAVTSDQVQHATQVSPGGAVAKLLREVAVRDGLPIAPRGQLRQDRPRLERAPLLTDDSLRPPVQPEPHVKLALRDGGRFPASAIGRRS